MKKLSNTEAELKKSVAYKKKRVSVYKVLRTADENTSDQIVRCIGRRYLSGILCLDTFKTKNKKYYIT